jgi:signal transduction histidine kinase
MKIRTRLTFWYAAILTGSLLVMGFGLYREIIEQANKPRHHLHPTKHAFKEAGEMVLQIGLPAMLLGVLGGWWITRRALAPVTSLTEAVEKIHERNLDSRLARSGNGDELDRLTDVFNAMTERLDASFQRIREFTLHASHELKTPLTVMRGELETALAEEPLTAAQKERLLSQMDEIERLGKIVDGLTLLTKADSGQVELHFEKLRLDDLVRESFADAKILAQPQNIHVSLEACEAISFSGDRHRLRQMLLNLTDNAIKYNWPDGTVKIGLRRVEDSAELKIENTGAGIPVELQPRLFERFFRGDASHSQTVEGCGLGLSIVRWIVSSHKGTIQILSEPGRFTTATLRLPCV